MPLVMVPACAQASELAVQTQSSIKVQKIDSLARQQVIHSFPLGGFWRERLITLPAACGAQSSAGRIAGPRYGHLSQSGHSRQRY
jgi:hypothetical protein